MANYVTITVNMPDYVSQGDTITIGYTISNPLDTQIDVYIMIYYQGEVIAQVEELVDPFSSATGSISVTVPAVPFTFTIRGEAYSDGVTVGEGNVEVTLSSKPKINIAIPMLIGIGGILWGVSSER